MKTIEKYIEHAVKMPENKLTEAFLKEHILVVKDYALQLGRFHKANPELLTVSALLHDVSAVLDFQTLPIHNIRSAEIAESILRSNGYKTEEIEIVKSSIEKHLVPLKEDEGTIYEVILSNADAMAQIARPEFWMFFATQVRKLSEETALKWYSEKVESNWNNLIPIAQKIIANKRMWQI